MRQLILILGILLTESTMAEAELWSCQERGSQATLITSAPSNTATRVCRPFVPRRGAYTALPASSFDRFTEQRSQELQRLSQDYELLPSKRSGDSTAADQPPEIRWTSSSEQARQGSIFSEKCRIWGTVTHPSAKHIELRILRAAVTLDRQRLRLSQGKAIWERRLRGACRDPQVSARILE